MDRRRAIAAALGRVLGHPAPDASCIGRSEFGNGSTATLSVDSGRRRVFVKLAADPDRLAAEADGLAALAACTAWRTPQVFGLETVDAGCSLLALEYLDLADTGDEAALGGALAELHAIGGPRFGWHRDNFIGTTPQGNGWDDDACRFIVERRLRPQLQWAAERGAAELGERAAGLLAALPARFAVSPPTPSLVHGDLWRGNVGFVDGRPAVFDPAVHYGDAEADIAMSELFGGFGRRFYAAYRDARPEPPDGRLRRRLHALYHLLNHFNLFAGGYATQARRLIDEIAAELGAR